MHTLVSNASSNESGGGGGVRDVIINKRQKQVGIVGKQKIN